MDVFATPKVAQNEKDLEIIMLRQQVRILQRKTSSPRISKPEKLILTAIANQMKQTTNWFNNRLQRCLLVFKPHTPLKWHREMIKRKWTFKRKNRAIVPELILSWKQWLCV
jgi:hypothetical protein